jgi:hypothetical protein
MNNAKPNQFGVRLACIGNPDFGQDPDRPLPGVPCLLVGVPSLKDAVTACRKYIREHQLGGGNWSGGEIIDLDTRKIIGRVSYNGRVWDNNDREIVLN